jgi:hypothetical protein
MLGKGLSGEIILQLRGKVSRQTNITKYCAKSVRKKKSVNILIQDRYFNKAQTF